MRFLIIDDDYDVIECLEHITSLCGDVERANNGIEGLLKVEAAFNANLMFNVVLLDVVLPELDGFTIIKHIRYLEETNNIPIEQECKIVVITERYDEPTVLEAVNIGATGIIKKPIQRDEVLANIKRLRITKGC